MVYLNTKQLLINNILYNSVLFYTYAPHRTFLRVGLVLSVRFSREAFEEYSYFFIGLLISYKSNFISSSVILRNVIALYPLEYTFLIYSPLVFLNLSFYMTRIVYKKNKYLFLRRKVAPLSTFSFDYKFYY